MAHFREFRPFGPVGIRPRNPAIGAGVFGRSPDHSPCINPFFPDHRCEVALHTRTWNPNKKGEIASASQGGVSGAHVKVAGVAKSDAPAKSRGVSVASDNEWNVSTSNAAQENERSHSRRRSLSPPGRRTSAIGTDHSAPADHPPAYANQASRTEAATRDHVSRQDHPSPRTAGSLPLVSPSAYTPRSQNADRYAHTERSPTPTHVVPQFPYSSQLVHPLPAAPDLLPATGFSPQSEDEALVTLDLSLLPDGQTVDELLTHLAKCSNAAFPILHMPTLRAHVARALLRETLSIQRACVLLRLSHHEHDEAKLIFSDTRGVGPVSPEEITAGHAFASVFSSLLLAPVYEAAPSLEKLQVRLLHLQYTLYNPRQGNIWELSGNALRLAIDLGYHHERDSVTSQSSSDVPVTLEKDMRRRLFWSAFCIDRNLSIALGRPPGIPDDWINVQPISTLPDEAILTHRPSRPDSASTAESTVHRLPCPYKLSALHHIQIRRLQSEIQDRLYRLPKQGSILGDPPSPEWFSETRRRLVSWRRNSPPPTAFCSSIWCDLNYYITLTLLHRPSPMNPKPSKDALKLARQGASGVMRTYKDMIKADRINWRWLAMYQLFIAGIAYLNSLWQAAEQGWSIVPSYVEALLDMQVCTSVMASLSAITPGFTSLCSAFETVSERIIRELTSKASWGQMFSRASSPSGLGTNGGNIARLDGRTYGAQADDTGTDVPVGSNGQGHGPVYADPASWSASMPSELGWHEDDRSMPYTGEPRSASLDDILGRPLGGVPGEWDPATFVPGAAYTGGDGMSGGITGLMADGGANGTNGAGGINDILAALGMGQEPQATFDSFFLHPLPDFPSDDWAM